MARKKAEPGKMVRTSVPGIYRRNNAYVVRVYNPETKGRDDYTALSFEQAKELKADAEKAKRLRRRTGKAAVTVREWMGPDGRWLELFPRAKESTMAHHRERVRQYAKDFGDRLLPGCDLLEAREWAGEYPHRVREVRASLNDAKRVGLIHENPFADLERGRPRPKRRITVLTDEEVDRLAATAGRVWGEWGEQVLAPMIQVAAGTGARPGELFAIQASDLDLAEGEVHLWRQFSPRAHGYTTLKSGLDRRAVMLPRAVTALERMEIPEKGVIWRTVRDKPFTFRALYHHWPAVRAAFCDSLPPGHHLNQRRRGEIPGEELDFYELRHGYGTALARMGATPFEIAQAMGHQDGGKIAMDTYIHLAEADAVSNLKDRIRRAA